MENTKNTGLELILTEEINNVPCEIYKAFGFDGAITREKLGAALGYKNPRVAVARIHREHKKRLDTLSGVYETDTPGGKQEAIVYSLRGALEVCRWSHQPVADLVMDTLYAIFEKLLTTGRVTLAELPSAIQQLAAENKDFVRETIAPAIQAARIEQTQFMTDLIGLSNDDFPLRGGGTIGRAMEKRLTLNDQAARTLEIWKHDGKKIYTIDDLPEIFREGWARLKINNNSRKNKPFPTIVNYCGKAYFDINGFREIINMGIRMRIIERREACAALYEKTGLRYV